MYTHNYFMCDEIIYMHEIIDKPITINDSINSYIRVHVCTYLMTN